LVYIREVQTEVCPVNMKYLISALLLLTILPASAFQNVDIWIQEAGKDREDWTVIWEDNFETNTLDTTKWTKIPPNKADWGNYMTDDTQCYEIKDGMLYLKGIVNIDTTTDSRPYLTGGVYTKGKFAFQYGRIDIRAKLESATGAWPAIWMLSETNKYGKYPRNGEIDIMEHLNHDKFVYQTIHSYYTLELGGDKDPQRYQTHKIKKGGFNIYSLEWYPDKLVFMVNNKVNFEYPRRKDLDPTQWPFDHPFYILVDQQLEGSWVGEVDPDQLPVNMIIDYVRVYQ